MLSTSLSCVKDRHLTKITSNDIVFLLSFTCSHSCSSLTGRQIVFFKFAQPGMGFECHKRNRRKHCNGDHPLGPLEACPTSQQGITSTKVKEVYALVRNVFSQSNSSLPSKPGTGPVLCIFWNTLLGELKTA